MRTIWSTWVRRQLIRPICGWKRLVWYGIAFSKFPLQLSCCISSGFTDFRSTFDNFTLLVSVLQQIFQARKKDFMEALSVFLKPFFRPPKERLPWDSSSLSNFFERRNRFIGIACWVFANGPGDIGSVPGRVIPKTLKMVLDTSLLNTQQYKVRIERKVEQSMKRSSALPYTSL